MSVPAFNVFRVALFVTAGGENCGESFQIGIGNSCGSTPSNGIGSMKLSLLIGSDQGVCEIEELLSLLLLRERPPDLDFLSSFIIKIFILIRWEEKK